MICRYCGTDLDAVVEQRWVFGLPLEPPSQNVIASSLDENDPVNRALQDAWDACPVEIRKAFHNVTCLNSRTHEDLTLVQLFMDKVQEEAKKFTSLN